VPKCRAASHILLDCKEFPELPPKCQWRNRICNELCQEQNKCRHFNHQLLHVEVEDWRNLQAAKWAKPAEPPNGRKACDDTQTVMAGAMLDQTVDERGEVHLKATSTVGKQLEKAEMLLRLMEYHLVPTEVHLMEAEVHLRSAKVHLEANEERRLALPLAGEAACKKSCGWRAAIRFRCEGP
jgi:hypothetical protein